MDVRIIFTLIDYSGRLSTVTLTPPQEAEHSAILVGAQRVAERLDAVSTAEVVKATIIYVNANLGLSPASVDSDVYTRCICIFSEGGEWGSISVPSVGALPFDADGPYANIRLTREALVLSGMLADVESIAAGQVRPDGSDFPTTFVVGGLTRIKP